LKSDLATPVLYVTHAQAEADVLADQIVHIEGGRIKEIEAR